MKVLLSLLKASRRQITQLPARRFSFFHSPIVAACVSDKFAC